MKFTQALVQVEEMFSYNGEWANKNVVQLADGTLKTGLHYSEAQALVAAGVALPKYALNPIGGFMPKNQNIVLPSQLQKALRLPIMFLDGKVNPAFTDALERVRDEVLVAIKQKADRADKETGTLYPDFEYKKLSTTGFFAQAGQQLAMLGGDFAEPTLLGVTKSTAEPVAEETPEVEGESTPEEAQTEEKAQTV